MSDATPISIVVVLLVLSVFIIIANTFTVFVFWIHRHKLKRTFLTVFNLTVADLFVGLVETVVAGSKLNSSKFMEGIPGSFLAMASGASVFFLVLVSLERAFALIWPLRHRVTSTKVYTYSVAIIWLAGLSLGALNFLTTNGIIDDRHYLFSYSIITFFSLFVICWSYLLIRKRLYNRNPAIDEADCRKRVGQNAKFSKTVLVVIGASVTLWAPSMTLYNINLWLGLLPGFMNYLTNFLHVTNSLVNPVIYSFRTAVFKKTLKQLANTEDLQAIKKLHD
ncbi:lysophosphatidic acid receptor 1-B-like [Porites lutea]|uniref:lysophosphatidic acid receptor 1-B-like n=1 Tax=Porites lutea TaxID=51062 RepID=UPI003CC65D83